MSTPWDMAILAAELRDLADLLNSASDNLSDAYKKAPEGHASLISDAECITNQSLHDTIVTAWRLRQRVEDLCSCAKTEAKCWTDDATHGEKQ